MVLDTWTWRHCEYILIATHVLNAHPHARSCMPCGHACGLFVYMFRRQRAKDKEKLQDLICELDEYVRDMDAGGPPRVSLSEKVTCLFT